MSIKVFQGSREASDFVAQDAAEYIKGHPGALLCLAAGDTPLEAYRQLVAMQRRGEVDLNSVYYIGLDEWVGVPPKVSGTCHQVLQETFYVPAGIDPARVRLFDSMAPDIQAEMAVMQAWLKAHGGIAYTIVGVGLNGHIGFNEPGTGLKQGCILVDLDEVTRRVATKYFRQPVALSAGVTIGAGELLKADRIVIMALGEKKAEVVRAFASGEATEDIPITLFRDHWNLLLVVDKAAMGGQPPSQA